MNTLVLNRLDAIRRTLLCHYQSGAGMPNAVIGSEREPFVSEYLAKVLPPTLRIGRGCVTVSGNNLTGQLDVVIEYPFVPNFPMPSTAERLYLAESVAMVIEVKSDFTKQWDEITATTRKVRLLRRDLRQPSGLLLQDSADPAFDPDRARVYCYAVGYQGHQTLDGLQARLDSTTEDERPDGALVIDSGCYIGHLGKAEGAWGLYALLAEMTTITNAVLGIANPIIAGYGKLRG